MPVGRGSFGAIARIAGVVTGFLALVLALTPSAAAQETPNVQGLPCTTSSIGSNTYRATCVFKGDTTSPISLKAVLDAVGGSESSPIYIAANGGEGGAGFTPSGASAGQGGLQGYAASYFDSYTSYLSKFDDSLYVWLGRAGTTTQWNMGGGSGGASTIVLTGSPGSVPVACMLAQPAAQFVGGGSYPISAFSNSGSTCTQQNVLLIAGGGGGGGSGQSSGDPSNGGGGGDGAVAISGSTSAVVSSVGAGGKGADGSAGGDKAEGTGGGPGSFTEPGSAGTGGNPSGQWGTQGLGGYGGGAGSDPTGFVSGPGSYALASTVGLGGSSPTSSDGGFGAAGGGGGGFGGGGSGAFSSGAGGGGGGGSVAAVGDKMGINGTIDERPGGDGSFIIVVDDVQAPGAVDAVQPPGPGASTEGQELPRTGTNSTTGMVVLATLLVGIGIVLRGQRRPT
jgi:LPXTG-motif cell wall-anchored protein